MAKCMLFVCVKNAARSQMAEGFFNPLNRIQIYVAISADRPVNAMTIDALLVTIIFPYPMYDDMHRRRYYSRQPFLFFALIPLYGSLFYLLLRPQLEMLPAK
ncbi:MAG: hypothetical protein ACFE7A_00350 [Promethearchaeota archaeon]